MFLRTDREHAAHPSRRPAGAPQGEEIKNSPHPDVRGLSRALKGDVRRRTALVAALCIGLSFVLCCDLTVSASAQNAGSALVEGFRSAKFGADEKTVRAAIKADFGLEGKAVSAEENPVEKTTALVATVDALEPGGKAQIAYILGYKSKKLIQVNVVWGAPVDPGATAEKLTGTAVLLRNYFTQQSFAPDRRQQDQRLQDGSILFFQGTDAQDRQVSLHLLGVPLPTKEGEKPKAGYSLRLSYVADPKSADIFQLKAGSF